MIPILLMWHIAGNFVLTFETHAVRVPYLAQSVCSNLLCSTKKLPCEVRSTVLSAACRFTYADALDTLGDAYKEAMRFMLK